MLFQDASLGSFVAQCNATDSDAASNAQITYHIVEGETNKFSIDKTTGVITTSGEFDRDTGVKEYVVSSIFPLKAKESVASTL